MSKNSFYFSHDNNARNDEKILAVRMELGAEGYGIYFMLLEKLVETGDYILIKDYNRLAFDLRVSSEKIKKVIENFGLFQFTEDGKLFYSESLLRRMKPLDNLRKQRSEAGKKSAEKRQQNNKKTLLFQENSTTVERPLQENSTEKVKESKVKESKVKEKKEKDEKEKFSSATTQQILLSKKISLDQWAMMFKISPEHIKECVKEFADFKERHGENLQWTSESDMTKNFEFWLRSNAQPKEIKKPTRTENSTPRNIFRNKTN